MVLRLLLCRRFRARWRMSSDPAVVGARLLAWLRPHCCVGGLLFWSVVCCGGEVE